MTGEGVDRIRAKIRARVFTRTLGGNSSDQTLNNEKQTDNDNKQAANGPEGDKSTDIASKEEPEQSLGDKEKLAELAKTL